MLALLNSKPLELVHKVTSGTTLYAKRFREWTAYLKTYPIPDIIHPRNSARVDKIIENTHRLVKIFDEQATITLEKENDRLVYQLFDLTDQEIEELETTLTSQSMSC